MSKSTQESLNEALSAAVDGEAEELELRRVLNAAGKDPELRAKWERLHLVRSIVRGEATRPDSAEGHGLDIGGDPAEGEASGSYVRRLRRMGTSGRWTGPVTGIAVAAAVVIAVALDTLDTGQPEADAPLVAVSGPADPTIEVASTEVPSTVGGDADETELGAVPQLASVPSEADLARAREYLVQHAHQTSYMTPTPGMPHVKVLAVSSTEAEER